MSNDICIGPNSCSYCGGDYGDHRPRCDRPPDRKSAAEIEAAIETWMRTVTDAFVGNQAIRYDEQCAIVEAFAQFRASIGRPLRMDPDEQKPSP